ncbi:MAG: SUMF1/EgtB/PvdO family nonheme iron enzyme [Lewinellaceae bacterium]|nr:SUMF1/EgtB/PvdO family nonheme iron enzyme [Lewinellaceae bacterium]
MCIGIRVVRGGSWNNNSNNCRSTNRNRNNTDNRNNNIGFRLARNKRNYDTPEPGRVTGARVGSARVSYEIYPATNSV